MPKYLSINEIIEQRNELEHAMDLVAQAKEILESYCDATGDENTRQYLFAKLDIAVEGGVYHAPYDASFPKVIASFNEEYPTETCSECNRDGCDTCDYEGEIKSEEGEA